MPDIKKIYAMHCILLFFASVATLGISYFSVTHMDLRDTWWVIGSTLCAFVLCCMSLICIQRLLVSNSIMLERTQEYAEKLKASQDELQYVLNCLEPGVVKIIFDSESHRTIAWANDGFFELSGHGREGYAAMGEAHNIVHPDDMGWVFKAFAAHTKKRDRLSIEYRIMHKNGSIVWLHVTSNYVGEDNGNPVFICIMMDITAQKDMRDKLLLERQRYELINSLSQEILFEYDADEDTMTIYGQSSRLLGISPAIPQFSEKLKHPTYVHPDDAQVLVNMLLAVESEAPLSTPKFRLRLGDGSYQWYFACYSALRQSNDTAAHIVGKLVNIHESSMLIEELQIQSALDGMTALYNKSSFEKCVQADLATSPLGKHAFLIADVDDFKSINDTYGHPYGDEILKAVAQTLKNSFRKTDRIGRAGGDEFVVLMRDVNERHMVEERVEAFYAELHKLCIEPHKTVKISVSIGGAMCPQHGKNYEQLFAQADHAMYGVKRSGKGHFAFYTS